MSTPRVFSLAVLPAVALSATVLLAGCRPDAGAPAYPDPEAWDPTASDPDFFGEDPFAEGDDRLSLGVFYEGGASWELPVDDVTRHFYVYESTFTAGASDDRVEGYVSDELAPSGNPWWGGGVHWDSSEDLTDWDTLHVSLKSGDESMVDMTLGMTGGGTEARVTVGDVGFVADGTWQTFDIPLQSFVDGGTDLSSVSVPLVFGGEGAAAGTSVLIDDLYFTISGEGTDAPEFLAEDPYEEGEQRLSLGAFYEGGYSEVREVDGELTNFYIYSNTFTIGASDDRVEGLVSDLIEIGSSPWWGGGIHWGNDEGTEGTGDLSDWDTLHIAFRSASANMESAAVGMTGGGTEARLSLGSLGFVADGTWQHFDIPLSRFADGGADLSAVNVPLLLVSEVATSGDQLWVDDVYITAGE